MSSSLKVGIVGAGFIARFQLAAIRLVRGMEVAGNTSLAREPEMADLAVELGIGNPKIYPNVTEMAKHVDCIAIFSQNFSRIAVLEEIVAAVKAGSPLQGVICEKPLGRTVAEARRMIDLAASVNLRTA